MGTERSLSIFVEYMHQGLGQPATSKEAEVSVTTWAGVRAGLEAWGGLVRNIRHREEFKAGRTTGTNSEETGIGKLPTRRSPPEQEAVSPLPLSWLVGTPYCASLPHYIVSVAEICS